MRYMMIVKETKEADPSQMPSLEEIQAMTAYNESLVKAGVLLDSGGLQPSADGFRVSWPGGKPQVTDGPFAETKELIVGFWIIEVKSHEEALEWAKRIPGGDEAGENYVEVRPIC